MELNFHNIRRNKILFSPLNWGMGHVSRSISIIRKLLDQDNEILLACNTQQKTVYLNYFPEIRFIAHEGYPFQFSGNGFEMRRFIQNLPSLYIYYQNEIKFVDDVVTKENISLVISDHRYGFRSSMCQSIFITHQCVLPLPRYLFMGQWVHSHFIKKFSFIWIVDDLNKRFAGRLSQQIFKNSEYIGIQSRFKIDSISDKNSLRLLILSGPLEFQNWMAEYFLNKYPDISLIIGPKASTIKNNFGKDSVFTDDWVLIDSYISKASIVYSVCGYSTLMDVEHLKCHWVTIPTPGQMEQSYLFKQKKSPVKELF